MFLLLKFRKQAAKYMSNSSNHSYNYMACVSTAYLRRILSNTNMIFIGNQQGEDFGNRCGYLNGLVWLLQPSCGSQRTPVGVSMQSNYTPIIEIGIMILIQYDYHYHRYPYHVYNTRVKATSTTFVLTPAWYFFVVISFAESMLVNAMLKLMRVLAISWMRFIEVRIVGFFLNCGVH